ncbi:pantoate--beta-alanine ligase [bacterium]|nr:pantoate--beta-alanine ligase [bacterium]
MRPEVIVSPVEMSVRTLRNVREGKTVGLVPTMGALHKGHLSLVERAAAEVDVVVVSIFVNPTQFGPNEDLESYPRNLEEDVSLLEKQGLASVVFAPTVSGMYPYAENKTWVIVEDLDRHLCGSSRPGHFKGVTTIVSRLLAMVQPDAAFFGLKDAQQFYILKRMAAEMGFRTRMKGVETVREYDGLALSSRNGYLSQAERDEAVVLSKAVFMAKKAVETGSIQSGKGVQQLLESELNKAVLGRVDYASVVDSLTLQPVVEFKSGQELISAVAVQFGKARLIDNSIALVP